MIELKAVLEAWKSDDFSSVLKSEIESLSAGELPLQKGLRLSSYAIDDDISATVINITETDEAIEAKLGIFYQGIIAGCSCADDPSPTDLQTEYCEVNVQINKANAGTVITLI